jgi:hypothetical protein
MNRTRVAWLLALPLSAIGMLVAHQLAWEVASHDHGANGDHGYLQYGAIFAALAAGTVIVAAATQLIRVSRGSDIASSPSARVFAVIPIVAFVLQEHLEHLVFSRELEVTYFLSPPFLLGLALQLPFALAAMVVARLILGLVKEVVATVELLQRLHALRSYCVVVPAAVDLPVRRGLVAGNAGRAPPRLR